MPASTVAVRSAALCASTWSTPVMSIARSSDSGTIPQVLRVSCHPVAISINRAQTQLTSPPISLAVKLDALTTPGVFPIDGVLSRFVPCQRLDRKGTQRC